MRELRQSAYNTSKWRKIRLQHLKEFPLCTECLKKGIVKAASQVHHKKGFIRNGKVNYDLFFDSNNLESICSECHGKEHAKENGYVTPDDIIKQLEDLLNNGENEDE